MVMVLLAQVAETPGGKPFAPETPLLAIPVATVVAWVIGVSGVLMHKVGVPDAAPAVLYAATLMVPVALTVPQPSSNGIV